MGLYLGSNKYTLHIGSSTFVLAIKNLINGIALKSSNGHFMKTSNGLYLTVKDGD